MKPITTDTYTFSDLIDRGCVYVDKTDRLLALINDAGTHQYFMARPRRFGKSLTITTLMSIFEGKRELFKGLAIDRSDYDWKVYPVIRLDMGSCQAETVGEFREKVANGLRWSAHANGVELDRTENVDVQFGNLMKLAAAKSSYGKVVLLIDEYDKPLLGHLGRPTVETFRNALKSFYSVIKTCEHLQRFTFITGVSKFSKVSIFSDLNNLTDITLSQLTATLCGYTHDEVLANFSEHLEALGQANGLTAEAAFDKVLKWYNGYRFHQASETVVNPVSLGRCLADREFRSYWYETGTPTFLVNELKRTPIDISELTVLDTELGTYEPGRPAMVPLLFQTGYLTIKSFRQLGDKRRYTLGFPNKEVRNAFHTSLVNVYVGGESIELGNAQDACAEALIAHDLEAFREALLVFFANIPYNLTDRGGEQIFQAILYTILRFIGVCVETEVVTNKGRIDATVVTDHEIYVIEIKLDHTAAEAIDQIKNNGYADKFRLDPRRITLIGMGFSAQQRTISDWKTEDLRADGPHPMPSGDDKTDAMIREAIKVIYETKRASVSHFQRRMGLGYNNAARVMDLLEDRGVVAPATSAGPRQILWTNNQFASYFAT